MGEVGSAYVRIRPMLDADERDALQKLAGMSRSLADGLDNFLSKFPPQPALEEEDARD